MMRKSLECLYEVEKALCIMEAIGGGDGMVRETRHLWVGNLPKDVREDKITEHFERSVSLTAEHMVARSWPRPCQRGQPP